MNSQFFKYFQFPYVQVRYFSSYWDFRGGLFRSRKKKSWACVFFFHPPSSCTQVTTPAEARERRDEAKQKAAALYFFFLPFSPPPKAAHSASHLRLEMPTWQKTAPAKFAQYYNVSVDTPPPDVNVPVHTASEHLARVIRVLPHAEVTEAYMRETGFRFPTLVPDGLVKLAAPPETFTAAFVAAQIGTKEFWEREH